MAFRKAVVLDLEKIPQQRIVPVVGTIEIAPEQIFLTADLREIFRNVWDR